MASQTRSSLTLGTLTLVSIKFSLYGGDLFSCVVEAYLPYIVETAKGINVTLDDPASLCR